MLGSWVNKDKPNETYTVTKQDEFTLNIESSDKKSDQPEYSIGYLSVVNGITFINTYEKLSDSSKKKYSFYKIEMKGDDKINLSTVTENITERFTSSVKLKNFISGNLQNSYFYDKEKPVNYISYFLNCVTSSRPQIRTFDLRFSLP